MVYTTIRMVSPKTHNGHTIYGSLTLGTLPYTPKVDGISRKVNLPRISKLIELTEQAVSSQ